MPCDVSDSDYMIRHIKISCLQSTKSLAAQGGVAGSATFQTFTLAYESLAMGMSSVLVRRCTARSRSQTRIAFKKAHRDVDHRTSPVVAF